MDNFPLAFYPWQQMSASHVLKILFCHDAWHKINKNKPRISVLVERARESPASAGRQDPDGKKRQWVPFLVSISPFPGLQSRLNPDWVQENLTLYDQQIPACGTSRAGDICPPQSPPCVTGVTLVWLQSDHTSTGSRTKLNQEHQHQKANQDISPHGDPDRFFLLSPLVAQVAGNDILKKHLQGFITQQFCLKGQLGSS